MSKSKKNCLIPLIIVLIIFITIAVTIFYFYGKFFTSSNNDSLKETTIFIHSGSSYEEVVTQLVEEGIVKDKTIFNLLAKQMNYPAHVHPGRFTIRHGTSIYYLIRKLRSAESEPVLVALDRVSDVYEWAAKAGHALEIDSATIADSIFSDNFLEENKVNSDNVLSLFLPDTYEFYWEISLKGFINRMKKEYDKFWTSERITKAERLNLTTSEIYILASIVQEEAVILNEMPRIAGVYFNRLNIGMPLQADPTIKYIVRKRRDDNVYLADYKIVSPYNTYENTGLPPGPIAITTKRAIDAVLNAESHNYIYFCASADGSGAHLFTADYNQHLKNRNLYLNAKK